MEQEITWRLEIVLRMEKQKDQSLTWELSVGHAQSISGLLLQKSNIYVYFI